MANQGHSLCKNVGRNYQQLTTVKLPKTFKTSSKHKLYPIEVIDIDGSHARIHYIGYDDSTDEWRYLAELVATSRIHGKNKSTVGTLPIQLYSLYNELRVKVKQALVCQTGKQSPTVTIDIRFDYLQFKGSLQAVGITKQNISGNTRYKLRC